MTQLGVTHSGCCKIPVEGTEKKLKDYIGLFSGGGGLMMKESGECSYDQWREE
jgi:hypothetical protein